MTVQELKEQLDFFLLYHPEKGNWRACVLLSSGGFPGQPVSDVESTVSGFDHDSGKFMLRTKERLIEKPKSDAKTKRPPERTKPSPG